MIVLDSSAILAVLFEESDATHLAEIIDTAPQLSVSAANVLECAMRLSPAKEFDQSAKLDQFLDLYGVSIRAVDLAQLKIARAAFLAFGKGRHPARLNYGDCFAYALAKALDAPLLFVGRDFSQTDLRLAAP